MFELYFLLTMTVIISIWFTAINYFLNISIKEMIASQVSQELKSRSIWTAEWMIRAQLILMVVNGIAVITYIYSVNQ